MAADPYHGVTMTFSGANSGLTLLLTSVTPLGESRESVETTYHSTTNYRTYKPEALRTTEPLEIEAHFESNGTLPAFGAAETVTVSIPIPAESSDTTKATVAGTAYLMSRNIGEMVSGSTETAKLTATFQWDGATEVAFTAQSA